MSYIALATNQFDAVTRFYGAALGFPTIRAWDRPRGRGCVFDLQGLRLEILDASREQSPHDLGSPGDRINIVVEVADVDAVRATLGRETPEPFTTSWGAKLFQVRDPDGVPVWFLQWLDEAPAEL